MDTATQNLRCNNSSCRVETFKAADVHPLNCCPVCLIRGIPVLLTTNIKKEEPDG